MPDHEFDLDTGKLLKHYLNNSAHALIGWDQDVRFIQWSPQAEVIFGWTAAEVLGRRMDEIGFVFPDDETGVDDVVRQLLGGRASWNVSENRNRRKDGSTVWCRWFNAYVDRGDFRGFISLAEDITAVVQAREAATESEDRLQSLFSATPDSVTFFDLDGRVVEVNDAAARMMRLPKAALIGRAYDEFVGPENQELVRALFAQVLDGATINVLVPVRRPDGSYLHGNITGGPLRTNRAISGAFVNIHDVTEGREAMERIEASEERFRSLFDNNPDAMLTFDADSIVTAANAAAGRTLGRAPAEIVGRTLLDIVDPTDISEALASFNRALAGVAGGAEIGVVSPGGSIPTFLTMIPIRFRQRAVGVHVHVRDRRAEIEQQAQSETHAERIRDLYLTAAAANENAERQIAATLEAGCRILGMSSGALYEAETDAIVATFGDPMPPPLARRALTGESAIAIDDAHVLRSLHGDAAGEPFVAMIATRITAGDGLYGTLTFASHEYKPWPFVEVDTDLVQLMGALVGSAIERGRSRARLQTLAYTDTVTHLPNRPWLIEHLRQQLDDARATGATIGVLFLDLDRFKDINDTLGHESGDRLLEIIGKRLSNAIRSGDCVARMGGDEFVVLALDSPDVQALAVLAERIITAVEEPVHMGGMEQFVTTSIGVASYPADGEDAETLVKHADVAMYRAKDRGRNTYQFFTPALNATLQTRLSQEKTLRRALENEEFVVYYQPQHDLTTGALVAVEALVRWNHPRSGLVLPGHFIPNAELSGLIVAIGDFVLETACADIALLRRTVAPDLRLSVNLSARQFHQQRLGRKIRSAIDRTAIEPTALELEITESVAMSDAEMTINIMRDLGTEGVRLSVDDFGTGYSSLGYLRRFPLDSIKIDRSFVTDLASEPDDATIVRTVIAMAHALDLEVVAEGVESEEQLTFLREQRCDRVQGFYFSQAVPRAALEAYIGGRPKEHSWTPSPSDSTAPA
jgi:diguanylate cyclase (GGDEF)-like protein/PAS domain S-box-containing protein